MKQHNTTLRGAVAVAGLLLSLAAQADNMSFHGRLIEQAPCTVNNGENMQVEFGDIQVREVNGINHDKSLYVPLKCDGSVSIMLTHLGAATSFNSAAVQTNIADFGIQLSEYYTQNGMAFPMVVGEKVLIFDGSGQPAGLNLGAVPVKKSGVELKTGVFNGVSTLQLEYP